MRDYLVVSLIGGTWYVCAPSDDSIHNSQMRFDDEWKMGDFFNKRGWKCDGNGPLILKRGDEIGVYVFYRYREEKEINNG